MTATLFVQSVSKVINKVVGSGKLW